MTAPESKIQGQERVFARFVTCETANEQATSSLGARRFRIETFQAHHLPRVKEIFAAGMQEYLSDIPEAERDSFQAILTQYIDESFKDDLSNIEKVYVTSPTPRRGHFWVVIEELASSEAERVQGMVGLEYKSEKEAELRRMSIDSSVRRLGVASQLLAVLLSFAKSEGYKRVFLTSGTHMPAAHRFYEANGFKFSHVIPEESACYYYYELL